MIGIRTRQLVAADRDADSRTRLPDGERVYAIGDIHGRLDLFQRLVAAIRADDATRPAARTRLILLGDLVDRGRHSAELVDLCRAASEQSSDFVVLRGNHEQVMLDAISGNLQALGLWLRVGGREALASWHVPDDILDTGDLAHIAAIARSEIGAETIGWLRRLPLSLAAGDYLFVHAGIRPGIELDDQDPEDLLWIRDEFIDSDADHGAIVVHGHTIFSDGVQVAPNRIGIDTGAWRTGRLTALGLEGCERWTISTEEGEAAGAGAPRNPG